MAINRAVEHLERALAELQGFVSQQES
jgi:hypothetical protein